MTHEAESVIDEPLDEVFAWHGRPGAINRLLPPWQPVRVLSEADSLASGTAVLRMPGGIRWTAAHDPDSYRPPHLFADELRHGHPAGLPLRLIGKWRHEHRFADAGDGRTIVHDRVETSLPAPALRRMFDFRHRQLADELAALRRARSFGSLPSRVAITGSSGLIGSALGPFLRTAGIEVVNLVRRPPTARHERFWDPSNPAEDLLSGVDGVVHLAGATIAGLFTTAHKNLVRDSRVGPTALLADVAAATPGLRAFVTASAIGYYGPDPGEVELNESSDKGTGFLADVVDDWERASAAAAAGGIRTVNVRNGLVLSPRGGLFGLLRPIFAAGLGGRIGSGRQWMSWIDLDDLLDIYFRALVDPRLSGPVNGVAPAPVRNEDFTRTLGRVLNRPTLLPVPKFGPRLILGSEGARELALAGQRVVPRALAEVGHEFRRTDLEASLRHLLGRPDPAAAGERMLEPARH